MDFYHFQSDKKAPFSFMTFSKDLRWRALILFEFQGIDIKDVSYLLGVSVPSIRNWVSQFKRTGTVEPARTRRQQTRWPTEVVNWVRTWIKANPQFIFDEPKECLDLAFKKCSTDGVSLNIYEHCGYGLNTLNLTIPDDFAVNDQNIFKDKCLIFY
jgi:transposase-like protein